MGGAAVCQKYQDGWEPTHDAQPKHIYLSNILVTKCPLVLSFPIYQIRRANAHTGTDPGRDLREREGGGKRREGGGRSLQGREAVCAVVGTE